MSATPPVLVVNTLSPKRQRQVIAAADVARGHDGVAPISEETLLRLGAGPEESSRWRHFLVDGADGLAGYAHLDLSDADAPWAEFFVAPLSRRAGIGTALWNELHALAPSVRVWAHNFLPVAAAFARAHGLHVVRELWQMARPLDDPAQVLPEPNRPLPPGYTVTTFTPGDERDERDWLAVNAAAFASHPEQGRVDSRALHAREAEPWFDPAGFFLVRDGDGRLAAFHWTKVEHGSGEVYVVGVHPDYQGLGLGAAVTAHGLRYLRDLGLPRVSLYVDGENDAAIATYRRAGFERVGLDVQLSASLPPRASPR